MTTHSNTSLRSGHHFQQPIQSENGMLMWGQKPVTYWYQQAGNRACYIYDMAIAREQVTQLRRVLPDRFKLFYAVKANPNPQVLAALSEFTDGVDVASSAELQTALEAGYSVSQTSFAGPAKTIDEIHQTLALGGYLSIESITEARRVMAWAEQQQVKVSVSVRVNPQFQLKASGMHMGGGAQPFGIDEEQFAELAVEVAAQSWVTITGLHIYAGSQCLQVEALTEQFRQTLSCFERLCQAHHLTVDKLNFGGGIGVPYFPGNQPVDLQAYGDAVQQVIADHHVFTEGKELILELGRYVMAEAGIYLCQVTDIKESRGQLFAMVDGGMHHHLANSGNLGQLLKKNYPMVVANKMGQAESMRVTICGPLCTPLDVLARQFETPELAHGDFIAIFQSGAYGLTASPIGFLSQPQAGELVVV